MEQLAVPLICIDEVSTLIIIMKEKHTTAWVVVFIEDDFQQVFVR